MKTLRRTALCASAVLFAALALPSVASAHDDSSIGQEADSPADSGNDGSSIGREADAPADAGEPEIDLVGQTDAAQLPRAGDQPEAKK